MYFRFGLICSEGNAKGKKMTKTTITLVEDDNEVRHYLIDIIGQSNELTLLDAANNLSDASHALTQHRPDVLLVDLGLPDGSGVDLIKQIHQNRLDTLAMVISGFSDERTVFEALEAGAQGYILKHDNSQKILEAITLMLAGGSPISPLIARLMLKRFTQASTTSLQLKPELIEPLTKRQEKILLFVSQGFSSQEIAEKLSISYHTVTTHIKNIYGKLQVNSRAEAIFEAHKLGLLK